MFLYIGERAGLVYLAALIPLLNILKDWLDKIRNAMVHAARIVTEMGFVVDIVFAMNPSFQPDRLPVYTYLSISAATVFRIRPRNSAWR